MRVAAPSSAQGSGLPLRNPFSYGSVEEASSWEPAQSGSVVYGVAVVPLVCRVCCLADVVCSLSSCLMFLHLYLASLVLCTAVVARFARVDPMDALALHDPPGLRVCTGLLRNYSSPRARS
ncbi:unnamed protein product [Prorocentrum cordatum]|uniref:Uncharacterized protein n=1 Tax=Prorocentrum cordatum TaxID=2364126 RepID=A0ABN9Y783_9DINO|nr:unnamed protein product [Polarella glacialis]